MRDTPVLDALWCASHPFKCIGDALGPYWWVIGIFAALILIGIAWRLARAAYTLGGWPAVVGALGIIGTVIVVIATAFSKARGVKAQEPIFSRTDQPTDIDGPDAAPSPTITKNVTVRRKPLFPNIRKRLNGE